MKRLHANFVIDALAFVGFLFLVSTGVLLRYQLPPGSGGHGGRGHGPGEAGQSVTTLWGWSRHEWGEIHYWIACGLMAVLAVHLVLHWRWIFSVVRGRTNGASGLRLGLGAVGLAAVLLMTAAPWLSATQRTTRGELRSNDQESAATEAGGHRDHAPSQFRGSMSLEEVATETGLSPSDLISTLGLPDDVSTTDRVGPLLRSHGLRMSDLQRAVDESTQADSATTADLEGTP